MAIDDVDDAEAEGHQVNLGLGANTIMVVVTGTANGDSVTTTYTVVVTRGAASDAALSALSLGGVMLIPAFDAATTTYTANVANDVVSTTVMATAAHADATVDAPAGQIDLAEGANSIVVTVTAEDGTTTMTYTVVVARAIVEIVTVEGPGVTVSPLAALIEGETGSFNVSLLTFGAHGRCDHRRQQRQCRSGGGRCGCQHRCPDPDVHGDGLHVVADGHGDGCRGR